LDLMLDDPDVCGVNEAGKLLRLDHLATSHADNIEKFLSVCAHNDIGFPLVHIRKGNIGKTAPLRFMGEKLKVRRWDIPVLAGSAPFAAAAMVKYGYDKVIMCGCPMDGGGGYAFEDTEKSTLDNPRIGFENSDHPMIQGWHNCMRKFKEEHPEIASCIRSMSGMTREIFGGVNGKQ
ncbi:hypothetical protein KAR91_30620, partial [Candidatus Pacearchaeota archaeon]|nr:hypothetical protein [Candidatus Pacearchaeota archaeon]